MPTPPKRKFKSYMKPAQKRVTIQKPEQKQNIKPAKMLPGGFTRINDSTIRKIYK